jgi:hypothetical protein
MEALVEEVDMVEVVERLNNQLNQEIQALMDLEVQAEVQLKQDQERWCWWRWRWWCRRPSRRFRTINKCWRWRCR